jgi:hypothetical protein
MSRQMSPFFVAVKALPTTPSAQHLSRFVRRAGLKDCTGYDLWHTGVRRAVIAGVYPAPVKELIGPTDSTTMLWYAPLSSDHKQQLLGVLTSGR